MEDHPGDGMGWGQIRAFSIVGDTTNPNIISSPEKKIEKVTGRFGMGGSMSMWSWLLYAHSPVRPPPSFFFKEGKIFLIETLFIEKEEYLLTAVSRDSISPIEIHIEAIGVNKKKGRIFSCRGDNPLKIKLFEKGGEPYINIEERVINGEGPNSLFDLPC